jgi:hypothetical protein
MTLACTPVPAELQEAFPDDSAASLLRLILDAWALARKRVSPTLREVKITQSLATELGRDPRLRKGLFEVRRELPLDDPLADRETGRIDLEFTSKATQPGVYLGCECKRLRVPNKSKVHSGADAYVKAGMSRFFDEHKYGAGQRHGGMIGYVMDGQLLRAVRSVTKQIDAERVALRLSGRLSPSVLVSERPEVYQTEHSRLLAPLTLHHLFLCVS